MKENLDWSLNSHFNNAVLVFNLVTLLVVLAATGYFWQREVYIVSHLVPKPELPYNHLPTIYDAYPAIKRNVLDMNTGAFLFASFMTFCIVCNIIISSVFLFYGDGQYNYNLGSRTITTTITNLMLISSRITGYFSCAPAPPPRACAALRPRAQALTRAARPQVRAHELPQPLGHIYV